MGLQSSVSLEAGPISATPSIPSVPTENQLQRQWQFLMISLTVVYCGRIFAGGPQSEHY